MSEFTLTREEAQAILFRAKWVLSDMGNIIAAGEAEDAEIRTLTCTPEVLHEYADHVLPRGRRGHIRLCLNKPETARALAFVAGILRAVR